MHSTRTTPTDSQPADRTLLYTTMVVLILSGLAIGFILLDNAYNGFVASIFPEVGTSTGLATLWGIVSRLHVAIPALLLIVWKPKFFGLQIGTSFQHWRLILGMLIINCGVVAGYLWLSGSGTPYSGDQWLITEVITVPVIEEIVWRGIVFTLLLVTLRRYQSEATGTLMTVLFTGTAFCLMHINNIFAGVSAQFVVLQVVSAVLWGVMYSYARAKTDSVFPAILLHAAMNLVVVLF